jgi:LysR family transcriptional regulator, nitrogen assimilation regulatory protein
MAITPNIDIRQLNTFLTIAETGSFSRASERLFTAQPALSRQIRMLEEAMNVKLFIRHGRGVVMTAAGELLNQRAHTLLMDLERIRTDVAAVAGEVTGQVILGIIPSVAHTLSGAIIKKYRETYPQVTLIIEQAGSGELQAMVEQNRASIVVMYEPQHARNLHCSPFLTEGLYLISPLDSQYTKKSSVSFKQALQLSHAMHGLGNGLRSMLEKAAAAIHEKIHIDTEVNSLPLQLDMVRRGACHTILPYAAVHEMVSRGELCASKIISPDVSRSLVFGLPADRPASVATGKLREMIVSEISEQISSGLWAAKLSCESENNFLSHDN